MPTSDQSQSATRTGWKCWIRNGPLWLTVSAMLFSVMAILVRVAGQHGIPGSESTLIRFLIGLPAGVYIGFGKEKL